MNKHMEKKDKIWYRDVMGLGFKEEIVDDSVYMDQYGVPYVIISKKLSKKVCLEWDMFSMSCDLIRVDDKKSCNVVHRSKITTLACLVGVLKIFGKHKKKRK
jgi:hypothetical protein